MKTNIKSKKEIRKGKKLFVILQKQNDIISQELRDELEKEIKNWGEIEIRISGSCIYGESVV